MGTAPAKTLLTTCTLACVQGVRGYLFSTVDGCSRHAPRTTPPPYLPTGSLCLSTSTGRLTLPRSTKTSLQSLMPSLVTPVVMSFRLKTLSLLKSCVDLFCIYLHIYILRSSPCLVPCLF